MEIEIPEFCCGNCIYYNGDMRDNNAFCDEREGYVNKGFYCFRYVNIDDWEQLKEQK